MLLVFADATSIETANYYIREDGALCIEATDYPDGYLYSLFIDINKTKKMIFMNEESDTYENYMNYQGVMHFMNGTKEVVVLPTSNP